MTPSEIDQIETYFRLLTRWNRTINLTALRLDPPEQRHARSPADRTTCGGAVGGERARPLDRSRFRRRLAGDSIEDRPSAVGVDDG